MLTQSKKLARDFELAVIDGIDEIRGLNYVTIETPSDYDVGLYPSIVAKVYPEMMVYDEKVILEESNVYMMDYQEYLNDIYKLVEVIRKEKGWAK